MCQSNIETAATKKGVSKGVWNVDSKQLELTYDSEKTTAAAILKQIAYAGYDNEQFLAPDAAYAKLEKCCQYDRLKKEPVASTETVQQPDASNTDQEQATGSALKDVYAQYFALKDALIKDDGTAAAAKATALSAAIAKVDMAQLSAEQHTTWMKQLATLQTDANHIAGTKDVSHQREHFASLSTAMYAVMKVVKPEETVYYQHCPMYNDGKGADWLSKENTIKNPYYGNAMLSCGKTTETIK